MGVDKLSHSSLFVNGGQCMNERYRMLLQHVVGDSDLMWKAVRRVREISQK